jgi:phenylpyruvate tautomerase
MPLLSVFTSKPAPLNTDSFLKSLSTLLAHELGKPESYVMTSLHAETPMTFAGTTEPACFASLKSIGTFTPADTHRLSALLCSALSKGLGIPTNRVYLEFSNPPGHLWGHDGDTFA